MVHIARPQPITYTSRGRFHCYIVYVREGRSQRRVEVNVSDERWGQWEEDAVSGEDGVAAAVASEVDRVGVEALRGLLPLAKVDVQPAVPGPAKGGDGYLLS